MALRNAGCPVVGVVFSGPPEPAVEETITQMSDVAHLGRLDWIDDLNRETLATAFQSIDMDRIRSAL